ncbi:hypothetical protein Scep_024201 [Stephania cephalantha]|uniref:Uncharacterized protein n=1 Tax=Stephania cephalantha TaxID=152367 RepID=A0AAP0HY19_9MAGN
MVFKINFESSHRVIAISSKSRIRPVDNAPPRRSPRRHRYRVAAAASPAARRRRCWSHRRPTIRARAAATDRATPLPAFKLSHRVATRRRARAPSLPNDPFPRRCCLAGATAHRTSPSHRGSASRSHRAHLPVSSPICRRREPLLGRWPSAPASSLARRCTGSSRLRITREPRRFAPTGAPPRACCPSSATAADRCRRRVCRGSRHLREFASCWDVVSLLRSLALSLSLSLSLF